MPELGREGERLAPLPEEAGGCRRCPLDFEQAFFFQIFSWGLNEYFH